MTRSEHPLHRPHWTPALEESRGYHWWWNAHPPTWHKESWSIKKQHRKSNISRETLEFKARKLNAFRYDPSRKRDFQIWSARKRKILSHLQGLSRMHLGVARIKQRHRKLRR
jgi:hypothetical protein